MSQELISQKQTICTICKHLIDIPLDFTEKFIVCCGRFHVIGNYNHYKEVNKDMVEKKTVKKPVKAKVAGEKPARDFPRSYPKETKEKCVSLAKQGKTLAEIMKAVPGPKEKALLRYCRAAGVTLAR
jgi:hypothetical protein